MLQGESEEDTHHASSELCIRLFPSVTVQELSMAGIRHTDSLSLGQLCHEIRHLSLLSSFKDRYLFQLGFEI